MNIPFELSNINKYCSQSSIAFRKNGCKLVIPLSKTSNLNTSTNISNQSKRMAFAEKIRAYGTTQDSTSAFTKKTCIIGNQRFNY